MDTPKPLFVFLRQSAMYTRVRRMLCMKNGHTARARKLAIVDLEEGLRGQGNWRREFSAAAVGEVIGTMLVQPHR